MEDHLIRTEFVLGTAILALLIAVTLGWIIQWIACASAQTRHAKLGEYDFALLLGGLPRVMQVLVYKLGFLGYVDLKKKFWRRIQITRNQDAPEDMETALISFNAMEKTLWHHLRVRGNMDMKQIQKLLLPFITEMRLQHQQAGWVLSQRQAMFWKALSILPLAVCAVWFVFLIAQHPENTPLSFQEILLFVWIMLALFMMVKLLKHALVPRKLRKLWRQQREATREELRKLAAENRLESIWGGAVVPMALSFSPLPFIPFQNALGAQSLLMQNLIPTLNSDPNSMSISDEDGHGDELDVMDDDDVDLDGDGSLDP